MKAALYIRVSTDSQVEDGFSLAAQLKSLREYCVLNNIEIYKEFGDGGLSGQKEDRPQFQEMIKDAEKGLFQVILVHRFDRFARQVELSQKVKNRLKKSSVNVISITEPIEDSPIGFFQEGLLELLSEYYIRNLSKEVKKGLAERVRQGKHVCIMPYGYYLESGKVKINDSEAKVIKKIYELHLEGKGYIKIAMYLNENRVPIINSYHVNTFGMWRPGQIQRILANVKYTGRQAYGGEIHQAEWEPIIDLETFEMSTKSRGVRKYKSIYRGANFEKCFLLGILKCGVCDASMGFQEYKSGKRKGSKYNFVCSSARRYIGGCTHTTNYQVDKLTESIMGILKDIISKRSVVSVSSSKVDFNLVSGRKEKIVAELLRAKQAYLSGVFELDEYGPIKNKLELELADISELTNIESEQKELNLVELKNVLEAIENTENANEKRNILFKVINRIKISPKNIEIIYNI